MKRFIRSKKGIALLATLVVAAAAAIGAYAYFTATGSGSGSATVGTAANNLVITGTPDTTALTPGGTGSVITFAVQNPSNFNQAVSNIHLSGVVACNTTLVSNVCPSGHDVSGTGAGECDVSAFTMPDVTVNPSGDGNLGPNSTTTLTETGTLSMADNGSNQDGCKLANLALSFTSS